jgi:cardiolipin synthase
MLFLTSNPWFFWFFVINALVSLIVIILERKNPEKTIAWLLVFILLPPIGLFFYILFGRNWKKHTLSDSTVPIEELVYHAMKQVRDYEYASLIGLLSKNSESPLFNDNSITLFRDGVEKFEEFKKALWNAENHIHLEYFIVKDSDIGNEIKDILIAKASEGLEVRFLIDRIGSIRLKQDFINDLRAGGVEVVQYSYFLAPLLRRINTQVNYRNHRKIAVIDGKIGFLGGLNIGDEYVGKSRFGYWRDTHMMVRGDFVLGLQAVFLDDYFTIKEVNLETEDRFSENFDVYFPKTGTADGKLMQLVVSGPDSPYPAIMQAVLKMITMATDHIYITSPYFIPSESIMNALTIAAMSGIKVHILFPGRYDHILSYYASRTYLAQLVKVGVIVHFYDPDSFIHAKCVIVDGKVATMGTANMDIRSFELNYEINAMVYDEEIAEKLEEMFFEDLKKSRRVTEEYFENLPARVKIFEAFCRIFSALL